MCVTRVRGATCHIDMHIFKPHTADLEILDTSEGLDRLTAFCAERECHILAALPFAAGELVGLLSFRIMFEIIARWGGTDLYIPRTDIGKAKLAEILGKKTTSILIDAYHSGHLLIPAKDAVINAIKERVQTEEIQRLRSESMTITKIALRLGVHQRSIHRSLKAHGDPKPVPERKRTRHSF